MSSTPKARIAIVLLKLSGAGVQRMRMELARQFVDRGHEVDLVVARKHGELLEAIPEGVAVHEIAPRGAAWFFTGFLRYQLRRRPTHVLTSNDDVLVMVTLANRLSRVNSKVLASSHNAYGHERTERRLLGRIKYVFLQPMLRAALRRTHSIVAVSAGLADNLASSLALPRDSIRVIYNPVLGPDFAERLGASTSLPDALENDRDVIGFFGRLHSQKRVDLLLRAFATLRANRAAQLVIVGEGPERVRLEKLVAEYGMQHDVLFLGYSSQPYPLMQACKVVALASDYEGFGNVLVEAMACGAQVVSTDCPHGPAEILEGGRLGQLVPVGDHLALARALENSLDRKFWVDPQLLTARAATFTAETAAASYLECLGL